MDEALLCPQAAPARDQQLGDGRCEEGANCAQDWGPWMVRGCFSLILRWPEGTDSICSPSVGLRPHPCHSAQRAAAPGTSAYPVTSSCPRLPGSISEALLCCGADGVSKAVASLWEGGGSATMYSDIGGSMRVTRLPPVFQGRPYDWRWAQTLVTRDSRDGGKGPAWSSLCAGAGPLPRCAAITWPPRR